METLRARYHRPMAETLEGPIEVAALSEDQSPSAALRRLMAVTEASFEQRGQLERALKSRIVIEQAKGILAERLRVRPDEAFEVLRGTARSGQTSLRELARDVVEHSETPVAILAHLQRSLIKHEAGSA
jgi:DNA-binding transcriptional regulator YdaS (Cro superfamily)